MARRLSVSRTAYSHYEAGRNGPESLERWGIIAEALGITLETALAMEKARKKGA